MLVDFDPLCARTSPLPPLTSPGPIASSTFTPKELGCLPESGGQPASVSASRDTVRCCDRRPSQHTLPRVVASRTRPSQAPLCAWSNVSMGPP